MGPCIPVLVHHLHVPHQALPHIVVHRQVAELQEARQALVPPCGPQLPSFKPRGLLFYPNCRPLWLRIPLFRHEQRLSLVPSSVRHEAQVACTALLMQSPYRVQGIADKLGKACELYHMEMQNLGLKIKKGDSS